MDRHWPAKPSMVLRHPWEPAPASGDQSRALAPCRRTTKTPGMYREYQTNDHAGTRRELRTAPGGSQTHAPTGNGDGHRPKRAGRLRGTDPGNGAGTASGNPRTVTGTGATPDPTEPRSSDCTDRMPCSHAFLRTLRFSPRTGASFREIVVVAAVAIARNMLVSEEN